MKTHSKTVWSGIVVILAVLVLLWWGRHEGYQSGNVVTAPSPERSATSLPAVQQTSPNRRESSQNRRAEAKDSAQPSMKPLAAPQWAMSASGAPATAVVTLAGISHQLVPNQLGEFQRVYVEKGGSANVQVQFPKSKPGERVTAVMQDGGSINGEGIARSFTLDEKSDIAFRVDTTVENGISRVLLTCGTDRKTLQFWGGNEPPLKSDAP